MNIEDIPIFIVHYKELKERKEYLEKELNKYNFKNVEWCSDIDRNSLTREQFEMYKFDKEKWTYLNSLWEQYNSDPRELSKPEIACTITHIQIYKKIIDKNIKYALVLEDDCILKESFDSLLYKYLDELPINFDFCFLSDSFGWTINNYKTGYFGKLNNNIYNSNKHVYRMGCSRTTDSYLISNKGASRVYEKIIPFCLPIDWMLNPIFILQEMNVFWTEPSLISSGSGVVYQSSLRPSVNEIEKQTGNEIENEKIIEYSKIKGEFKNDVFLKLQETSREVIMELIQKIKNYDNFINFRAGDGEIRNMISSDESEHNCDGCYYYKDLGYDLIKSYIFCLKNTNAFIHRWHSHTYNIISKLDEDFKNYYSNEKFVFFDLFTHKLIPNTDKYSIDGYSFKEEQILFFRTIKESSRIKIYISNEEMIKAVFPLLNINIGISVPDKNCYLFKPQILEMIQTQLQKHTNCIVLFSCGMASKVFITELFKNNPSNTFIDIGSTFDGLIKHSRDFNGTLLYRDILLKCYSN